ncbi:MAG: YwaF family protein [Clostridia bacterium]|nr:YwaF family protein [Clostridia bacterium]
MFTGNYHFFEYKYNIPGYSGQDYGGIAQIVYLAVSFVLIVALLIAMRKTPREKALRIVGWLGVFMTVYYIAKTTWESTYDIQRSGSFNIGLLPLDSCSIIMPAAILAGFAKGRVQRCAATWVSTGSIVGALGAMVYLTAFRYYPFLSFGAFYSMSWHFLMLFMGLLLIATERPPLRFSMVTDGFLFHFLFSLIVIAVDFIWDLDFMFYHRMSDIPILNNVASGLEKNGLSFLTPVLMLCVYFVAFVIVFVVAAGVRNRKGKAKE